jgi:hypothetical protein
VVLDVRDNTNYRIYSMDLDCVKLEVLELLECSVWNRISNVAFFTVFLDVIALFGGLGSSSHDFMSFMIQLLKFN